MRSAVRAGLAAAAIACLILMSLLVAIGGMLFTGEWLFGSIGWGVLLGAELLIALALTAVLMALYVPGLGRDAALAILPGHRRRPDPRPEPAQQAVQAHRRGSRTCPWIRPCCPLVVGVVLVAVFGALVGLFTGARGGGAEGCGRRPVRRRAPRRAPRRVPVHHLRAAGSAIALGIATYLAAWPRFMGLRVRRQGIDVEVLKARFIPQTTIDTTKESIEWAKARVQREPKS